jgi:hypothetical protein
MDGMSEEEILRYAAESDPMGDGSSANAGVDDASVGISARDRAFYDETERRAAEARLPVAAGDVPPDVVAGAPAAGPSLGGGPDVFFDPRTGGTADLNAEVDPLSDDSAMMRGIYDRAAGLPPVTDGLTLPGSPAPDVFHAPAGAGPRPDPGWASRVNTAGGLSNADLAEAIAPRRSGGRRRGGAAPVAPGEERDPLIDALIARPAGAANPYDNRPESGLDRDLRLNDESRRLAQRSAELQAMAAADARDRVAGEMTARAELEAQRRDAEGAARMSYRRAADRAAAMSIDPDGFYHSRGVGGTIASSILIGLGGLSSQINGGPNVALEMINSEIDRDIMAQQQAIDSAFRRADAEGTLYDMTRQEYSDRTAALEAARALALEGAAAQVAESEASLGSAEARVQAEIMAGTLRDQAAASRAEAERSEIEWRLRMGLLDARARERAAAAQRAERRNAGAGGPAAPVYDEPTEARLNAANRMVDSGSEPGAALRALNLDPAILGPGATRFAEASTGDSAAAVSALSANLDEIESLIPPAPDADVPGVGMTGWLPSFIISDEGRQLREALVNASDLIGRLRSGAAVSEPEAERFLQILNGSGTDESLRRGIARIRAEVQARTSRVREGRGADDVEADALEGIGAHRVVED